MFVHSTFPVLALMIPACALASSGSSSPVPDCSSFRPVNSISDYHATILNTTYYDIGELDVQGTLNEVSICEIFVSVPYGSNDTLHFALWLPDTQYSSRFMAIGNGGFGAALSDTEMMEELNNGLGFAVAGSDAGHVGNGSGTPGVYEPFLHDEDQTKAWLHNSISLFTPVAKALINNFYGYEADYSYYRGCSTGGAQGFSLAEFHPDLFDGIIAGCAANYYTHLMLSFLWNSQQTDTNETYLSEPLLEYIQARVIEECDTIDGIQDKLVENPLECTFNISTLACSAGAPAANVTCLTPSQLSAAQAIYQGPVRADSSRTSIFPGLTLASEGGWWFPQVEAGLSTAITTPILQNLVYNDLSYDPKTFNWASDIDVLDERAGPLIDSISTDLSSFRDGGGKMIAYAGWADPSIAPMWTLQHVEAITKRTLGDGVTIADNDFLKLVMVPGGGHCGANIAKYPSVPAHYSISSVLVEWVEKGEDDVEGIRSWGPTNGDNRTRKLCTWPKVAKLKEGGDVDDWESYLCA